VSTAVLESGTRGSRAPLGTALAVTAPLLAGLAGYAVSIVLGYVLSPAEFGRLAVVQSAWTLWQQVLRFGVPVTVKRFLSSLGRDADAAAIVRSGALLNAGISVAAALVLLLVQSRTHFLGPGYAALTLFVAGAAIFPAVGETLANALLGFFEMTRFAAVVSADTVVSTALGIALAVWWRSAEGAMTGVACGTAATALAGAWFLRDTLRPGRAALPHGFATFAWWSLIGTMPVLVMLQSDVLLLRILTVRPDADTIVGFYRAAQLLARAPALLAFALSTAAYPYIAYYQARDADAGERIVHTTVRYLLLVALPFSLAMCAAPSVVLRLVFPAAYVTGETAEALRVLAAAGVAAAVVIVLARAMQAAGRIGEAAAVLGGASLVQLALFVFVVPATGIRGAAWSTLAGYGCGLAALGLLDFRRLRAPGSLRSVFRLAPALVGSTAVMALVPDVGRMMSALYFCVSIAVYGILVLATGGLEAGDWAALRRLVGGVGLPDGARVGEGRPS
jgi:O-antigen/teichoic acid export membrane protein